MEIPFYMYTESELEHKQTLMNTLNELNKKYPKWTYTTTEMLNSSNQNMAKLFVYLIPHTMTKIASINVDSDEGVLYQLRESKPKSPAEWLEAIRDVPGARFENGINGQILDADQLYRIMMALDENDQPTRNFKMMEFQGNFYQSSPMPKSPYQQAQAETEGSTISKLTLTSFEGETSEITNQFPHTYLLTPKDEIEPIKDIKKTLSALPFVEWPKVAGSIEEMLVLQQFVKYYRAMVLHYASASRPLLYVQDVDDAIPTIDALANDNNIVEDWTDGFEKVNNKEAFNNVTNAALIPGQWVEEGKHKSAIKDYQYPEGHEPKRYLYRFVDQNAVKRGATPNSVLEVDVFTQNKPVLDDKGQVMHKADMMDADEYKKFVNSHRPTASKKHANNRPKRKKK